MAKSDKFEKDYFDGYYKKMVGNFSDHDLSIAKKWFWGWFKALESIYDLKQGKRRSVLEIGCSIGGAAAVLAERGFEVTASDISDFALQRARKLLPHVTFLRWDATKKFPKQKKFNLIYGFEVIEHIPEPLLALKNLRQILDTKGVLILSTPFPYAYVYSDPTHVSVKHQKEWHDLFNQAGFSKVKFIKKSFIPYLYRFSRHLHFILPFSVNSPYINSSLFIIANK